MQFSCLVPVFNIEQQYLDICINSIIKQSFKDFELVIVDDGSNNITASLCDGYQKLDDRIRVVHQKNQGLAGARNTAISVAKGDWLVHIDGDDWIEQNMLELIDDCIKSNTDTDIIYFGYQTTINNKTRKYLLKDKAILDIPYEKAKPILLCSILSNDSRYKDIALNTTWGKAFRREFVIKEKLVFNTDLRRSQDVPYSLEAFYAARKICYIDEALSHYRIDNESLSRSYNDKTFDRMKRTAQVCLKFAEDHTEIDGLYKSACAFAFRCFKIVIRNDYMNKNNPQSNRIRKERFIEGIETEPFKSSLSQYDYKSMSFLDIIEAKLILGGRFSQLEAYYNVRSLIRKLRR